MSGRTGTRRYSPATVESSGVSQLLTIVVSAAAGLVVGSFLNVVVYRLPRGISVVRPPSSCPSCEAQLTLVDLVPVLSWVALRARCRHCGAHVSERYPLVELATGALCAGSAAALVSVWPLTSVAVLFVCALGASVVDADVGEVPTPFALVGALAAGSLLPIAAVTGHADRVGWAALGATLGFLAALTCARPKEAHGWAGVTILASLALAAGWFWAVGGAIVAAWVVVTTAATGFRAPRRAQFAILAAGSVAVVLASSLLVRP